MMLPQTKYIVIPHQEMPQNILYITLLVMRKTCYAQIFTLLCVQGAVTKQNKNTKEKQTQRNYSLKTCDILQRDLNSVVQRQN